jgi:hypothetical protein
VLYSEISFARWCRAVSHLQDLVELDLTYAIPLPTIGFSNDVREHLLESCKQAASAAAGHEVIWITGVLCDYFGKGKGGHLVFP